MFIMKRTFRKKIILPVFARFAVQRRASWKMRFGIRKRCISMDGNKLLSKISLSTSAFIVSFTAPTVPLHKKRNIPRSLICPLLIPIARNVFFKTMHCSYYLLFHGVYYIEPVYEK